MSSSFEHIVLSPLFTFIVGKEKKAIVVHANAIAATCDQMNVLINGNMNEAKTRCAEIENVEVEDFIRFCEYAYRGDFTVPTWKQDEALITDGQDPDALLDDPKPEVEELPEEIVTESVSVPAFGNVPKKKRRIKLRDRFENHIYQSDNDGTKAKILDQFNAYANDKADQDFTPVFLAYAHLYTFAQFRSIESLKALTLQKLHSTLKKFVLYRRRVGDITKLAEYAYTSDDLPSRGENGTIDSLRQLVVEYIACEIDIIGKCEEFVDLLEAGGEFVGDLWRITRKYLL
ncbi:hypothetical protein K504DRAFT_530661, partial [Pleomassaria siparia CBS 279.74]